MRIIDKINDSMARKRPFFSLEFFPPKTEEGLQNLYSRLNYMVEMEPAFIDVTWGAGGGTSEKTIEICRNVQQYFGVEVMMHLTCTNMPIARISETLQGVREAGLTNILALRGDAPQGAKKWQQCAEGLSSAEELAAYIRREHGDYFGLAVGGYPEGHAESRSHQESLLYLKRKVDAGADFIITQLFSDIEAFDAFVADCRRVGITCPIIPGVMPIHNYERFRRFVDFANIRVPSSIEAKLDSIKQDDAAVKAYGVDLCVSMCQEMIAKGVPGLHFYTLNLESSVTAVLKELGLVQEKSHRKSLPWRQSKAPSRMREDVRPIFWSNRPKSYLARTADWDDFPNGRWGDRRSPTFGSLNDYYLLRRGIRMEEARENLLGMWGEPRDAAAVRDVFVKFCRGDVQRLPWCETVMQAETGRISGPLLSLNQHGILTINSQPQVNGADSSDPEVGWGGPGGVVYQKAYVEFFASPEHLARLLAGLVAYPSLSFQAVDAKGTYHSNMPEKSVNAVTWGVFPGKEIIQPTVVDTEVFKIWQEEAFQLWLDEWRDLYEVDSEGWRTITGIHDTYFLCNIVENNFVTGDIFRLFQDVKITE